LDKVWDAGHQWAAMGIGGNAPWGIRAPITVVWSTVEVAVPGATVSGDPGAQGLGGVVRAIVLAVDDAIAIVIEFTTGGIHRMGLGSGPEPLRIDRRAEPEIWRQLLQLSGVRAQVQGVRDAIVIGVRLLPQERPTGQAKDGPNDEESKDVAAVHDNIPRL
jgi:hypothetical protein